MFVARYTWQLVALIGWVLLSFSLGGLHSWGAEADQAAVEFFEGQIRPLLAEQCGTCHGATRQEGGLRLDTAAGFRAGGDSRQDLAAAGRESWLLRVVRRVGELAMPPEQPLSTEQVALLERWVEIGAPWGHDAGEGAEPLSPAALLQQQRQQHWSLQPIVRPPLPMVRDAQWPRTPIDRFILAELEQAGLTPSPPVTAEVFLRRAHYDLLGLPPAPHEMEAWRGVPLTDDRALQIVERLLAAPAYGERWGRHWLDVARYADTRGYAFARDGSYPFAYTYRDYVIQAWNRDLPYDQFVREQLAADLLDLRDGNRPLAALGFLTVGRRFNNVHEDLDDRIDVVTRGFLGLTVACARCHDHKYDAVTAVDYYALYGIFASCHEPGELPVIGSVAEVAAVQGDLATLREAKQALQSFVDARRAEVVHAARARAGDYLATVVKTQQLAPLDVIPRFVEDRDDLRPHMVKRWREYIQRRATPGHSVWGVWLALRDKPAEEFSSTIEQLLPTWQAWGADRMNPLVLQAVTASPPTTPEQLARLYGKLLEETYQRWQALGGNDGALTKLPDDWRSLAIVLFDPESAPELPSGELDRCLTRDDLATYQLLQKGLADCEARLPTNLPRAMVLFDNEQTHDAPLLIRGNPGRPGPIAPRQFLPLLADQPTPYQNGSGRLQLAHDIASPSNPLTARVMANRVWLHHFGEPLVATPSDFGIRTPRPRHAALLDYLASRLIESGWSIKALHQEIMTSAVYLQSSAQRPELSQIDPDNQLWGRMLRRRLEFEALFDSLLSAAGLLDHRMYGPAVNLFRPPYGSRRAIYGRVDRQDLPALLRTFDFASPDQSAPLRPKTIVPQQTLFLLNSSLVTQLAEQTALRVRQQHPADPQFVQQVYHQILRRYPDADEQTLMSRYLQSGSANTASSSGVRDAQLAQMLFLSNEFSFID